MGKRKNARGGCTFKGCPNDHKAKGLCATHYSQQLAGKELKALRPRSLNKKTANDIRKEEGFEPVEVTVEYEVTTKPISRKKRVQHKKTKQVLDALKTIEELAPGMECWTLDLEFAIDVLQKQAPQLLA